MHTADDYREQLQALLPHGAAWPRDADATLTALLDAMAQELARIDARAVDLMVEADPRRAIELLPEWESETGLPDSCLTTTQTLQGRRDNVVGKLAHRGGQSRQYFIDLAAKLGFDVTITEYRPFRVGQATAGDALSNGDWIFVWTVNAPQTTIRPFAVGQSAVGEALRSWGNEPLECAVSREAPAHTILHFAYN